FNLVLAAITSGRGKRIQFLKIWIVRHRNVVYNLKGPNIHGDCVLTGPDRFPSVLDRSGLGKVRFEVLQEHRCNITRGEVLFLSEGFESLQRIVIATVSSNSIFMKQVVQITLEDFDESLAGVRLYVFLFEAVK